MTQTMCAGGQKLLKVTIQTTIGPENKFKSTNVPKKTMKSSILWKTTKMGKIWNTGLTVEVCYVLTKVIYKMKVYYLKKTMRKYIAV